MGMCQVLSALSVRWRHSCFAVQELLGCSPDEDTRIKAAVIKERLAKVPRGAGRPNRMTQPPEMGTDSKAEPARDDNEISLSDIE